MPGTWQAITIVAALIVPGYIAWSVLNKCAAIRLQSGSVAIVQLVTLGLVNGLVGGLLLLWQHQVLDSFLSSASSGRALLMFAQRHLWGICALVVGWSFVLPALLGYLLAFLLAKRQAFEMALDWLHLRWIPRWPTSWDKLFDRMDEAPLWVHVYIDDTQSTIYEGLTWHVNGYPDPPGLVIIHAKRKTAASGWESVVANYVYIDGARIRLIEAFDPKEPDSQCKRAGEVAESG